MSYGLSLTDWQFGMKVSYVAFAAYERTETVGRGRAPSLPSQIPAALRPPKPRLGHTVRSWLRKKYPEPPIRIRRRRFTDGRGEIISKGEPAFVTQLRSGEKLPSPSLGLSHLRPLSVSVFCKALFAPILLNPFFSFRLNKQTRLGGNARLTPPPPPPSRTPSVLDDDGHISRDVALH